METEKTEGAVDITNNEGEGDVETVSVSKADYDKLNQTVGSLKREIKDLRKTPKEEPKEAPKESQIEKSNEPDYAKLAYLKAEGVTHPDDQKIIQDEAARLKLSLTDVLQMEHMKSRLASNQDARAAQDGMPKGKGRTGGATNDVEYHLAKGTTPDDQELAQKVVNARMARETQKTSFSDTLYDG